MLGKRVGFTYRDLLKKVLNDFVWDGRRLESYEDRRVSIGFLAEEGALDYVTSGVHPRPSASAAFSFDKAGSPFGGDSPWALPDQDLSDWLSACEREAWEETSVLPILLGDNPHKRTFDAIVFFDWHDWRARNSADVEQAFLLHLFVASVIGRGTSASSAVAKKIAVALKTVRQRSRLAEEVVAARLQTDTVRLTRLEAGIELPPVMELLAWSVALGVHARARMPIVRIVDDITPELLRALRENPNGLRNLTPAQFERFVADRLSRMGFEPTLTGSINRKDGGIDIIATKRDAAVGEFMIAAQVKHHSGDQKTGREPVERLLSLKGTAFNFGLIVTNTAFTRDARWIAVKEDNKWFTRLRDFESMKLWLEENFAGEREFSTLPHEIELAPGVRIKVPNPSSLVGSTDNR